MKNKNKIFISVIFIAIFVSVLSVSYYINIKKNDRLLKLEQVYDLLSNYEKGEIHNIYINGKISKTKISSSNEKFIHVIPEYYDTTVYLVSFPTDRRLGEDFIVLCNLEINKIVGYGVSE